jgi:hypothetical protein
MPTKLNFFKTPASCHYLVTAFTNGLSFPELLYAGQVSGGQRDAGLQLPVQQLPGADGGAVVLEAASAPPPARRVGEQPRQPPRPFGGRP